MPSTRGWKGRRRRPGSPRRRGEIAALLGCLIALAPASAAEAAIGTPIDLGSSQAGGSSATSLTIITTQSAPAGSSIIVAALSKNFGPNGIPTAAACSDGAGNTYATDATRTDGSALTTLCSAHQVAGLGSGSSVTVTWSGAPPGTWNQRIRAFAVTGLAAAALDRTASANGSSTSPSSGAAAATTQPDELLVGAITDESDSASAAAFTPGTNGTANNCAATGTPTYSALAGVGSSAPSLFAIHCTVGATGSYTARGTMGAFGPTWEALLATYKAAPPNTFAVGAVKRNKKKGTATLIVNVPGPGELVASGPGARVAAAAHTAKTVPAAGPVQLTVRATGKKKKKLNSTGKVKLNLTITFTPTGGSPGSQAATVKLIKKH